MKENKCLLSEDEDLDNTKISSGCEFDVPHMELHSVWRTEEEEKMKRTDGDLTEEEEGAETRALDGLMDG